MNHEKPVAVLRIGELSRRVGVSEHVLRAWESRYGLLQPERSEGGYRLYSEVDQSRVRRMQAYLADGLAAAQAARAAIADAETADAETARSEAAEAAEAEPARSVAADAVAADVETAGPGTGDRATTEAVTAGIPDVAELAPRADLAESAAALARALDEIDEPAAHAVLDRLLTDFTVETVLRDVVMPYLGELGARWERGEVSVAQEHYASHVVRGRLEGLARGWGSGLGAQALLFCPPDEMHDLALLAFGIVLNRKGWRIAYLGVNTPMSDAIQLTADLRPALVVMAATMPERFTSIVPELTRLASRAPLALAGAGATRDCALTVGARLLDGDPVAAAEHLSESLR